MNADVFIFFIFYVVFEIFESKKMSYQPLTSHFGPLWRGRGGRGLDINIKSSDGAKNYDESRCKNIVSTITDKQFQFYFIALFVFLCFLIFLHLLNFVNLYKK